MAEYRDLLAFDENTSPPSQGKVHLQVGGQVCYDTGPSVLLTVVNADSSKVTEIQLTQAVAMEIADDLKAMAADLAKWACVPDADEAVCTAPAPKWTPTTSTER